MKEVTDQKLYERIKESDHSAFQELFDRYWKKMFGFTFRMLQNVEQSEDIVQEIFLSLWEKAPEKDVTHIKSYLYSAVKYQVSSVIRNKKWELDWETIDGIYEVQVPTYDPLELEEMNRYVENSIDKLPPKCKEVYYLQKEEGYTSKEIASNLNISPRTVEGHLHKAKKILKANLQHYYVLVLTVFYL
ncbi:RNA polymerase subunit sigma-70 [Echinicola strongylocentroti]|uniref:RNA polymerase subunit sigma-70 n=1 Tax=Echinicola strongylocentroti TaxID=1795355 RepID=A0A2Z4ICX0_9BACT|nr:RNA polymerase sigma-70 factor [Echinicola strongylocentroti]AWW28851.1 RNA polymerase subunit sigma-70 [Echinicola strongylocentroti]